MIKPKIQLSQIVFGDIIYWLTVTAAIFCMVGPVLAFLSMDSNVLNPHHLFANIWSGMEPGAIWAAAGEANGGEHQWIYSLTAGDGIIQLGLIIGCSVALPAMLAAACMSSFSSVSLLLSSNL